jgi:hypothetical protein
MNQKYQQWIDKYFRDNSLDVTGGYGLCREVSTDMQAAFPELRLVRGHVYCAWGKRGHWWLETVQGDIVDPTKDQFPLIERYEEWEEGDEVRLGRCMECGKEIWGIPCDSFRPTFCSKCCERSFAFSLM